MSFNIYPTDQYISRVTLKHVEDRSLVLDFQPLGHEPSASPSSPWNIQVDIGTSKGNTRSLFFSVPSSVIQRLVSSFKTEPMTPNTSPISGDTSPKSPTTQC